MKLDPNCPEANGFFAALEELLEEGDLTEDEAKAQADAWVAEHAAECPLCKKVNE